MNVNATNEHPQSTPEQVWALLHEIGRKQEETDRQMKETDRQMKETGRQIGRLGNRVGELVEHLIMPNILDKFGALGYEFDYAGPNVKIRDASKKTAAEIDVLLTDGLHVLAIEVKTDLSTEDVATHIERLGKLRAYFDSKGNARKILGAVAGAIVRDDVGEYAIRRGLFVIRQSGDTVFIDIPEGFTPREW